MKRLGRLRLPLGFVLFLAVVGAALFGCARLYLTSQHASSQVAEKLQAVFGVPVRLDAVDVGINGPSSLSRLQMFEADGQQPDQPWLTVDEVRTDLSAVDVVGGSSPRRVELRGAAIELRFDADGHLLTHLPRIKPTGEPFPQLVLLDSRLTLHQEGREPMVIDGIQLEAGDQDGQLKFHGTVTDALWGAWTTVGSFQPAEGQVRLDLQTQRVQVTQEKLVALPFVTPSAWRQVQLNGVTPVHLALRFTLGESGAHYRVELDPKETQVVVTSIDLHADKASGKVIVEDRLVQLRNVHGRTADGDIDLTSADLNFRQTPYDMTFDVGVSKVDLHQLPASWKIPIPPALEKQQMVLTGHANLQVQIKDGKAHPRGDGTGYVETALPGKIKVSLHADGERFRFPPPKLSALDLLKLLAPPPPKPPEPQEETAIEQEQPPPGPHPLATPVGKATQGLSATISNALSSGTKALSQINRWVKPQPGQKPTYVEANIGMKDADINTLLTRFQVQAPLPVSGTITFQVHAALPIDTPNDLRAYKLQGNATFPRLSVAGVEIRQLTAKVRYEDGVLFLEELHGQFPESNGSFDGDGNLQWAPPGQLTLKLRFDRVPTARVLALVPTLAGKGEGAVSGNVEAHALANRLTDPQAWDATGAMRSERLTAYGLTLTKMSLALTVKNGVAKVQDFTGELEGGQVRGNGEATWAAGYPFKGHMELTNADLAALEQALPKLGFALPLSLPIKGSAGGTTDFQGKAMPFAVTSSGAAQAKELSVEGVVVDSVAFKWSQDTDRVKMSDFAAKLYGGGITGSATIPLKEAAGGDANFKIDGVEVRKLARAVPVAPLQAEGQISGTVAGTISGAAPGKAREMTANIDLSSSRFRVEGVAAENLHGTVSYRGGTADYRLEGQALGGRIDLQGKLPVNAPPPANQPQEGRLRIQGVRLSRLGEALGMQEFLGPLSGTFELDLPFHHEAGQLLPVGIGRFSVRDVRWGGNGLSDRIQGDVRLTGTELQLPNISGELGEGSLRSAVVLNLKEFERSWFRVRIERVDAGLLTAPFLSSMETSSTTSAPVSTNMPTIQGPVDIDLRGRLGRQWTADGHVGFTHGKMYGMDLGDWRLPIRMVYRPASGTGQIDFSDNDAQIAQGRVQGRGTLYWGNGLRTEGSFRFFDVNVPTFLRSAGEASRLAGGRANGRLEFSGQNIHSVNDLNGSIDATFSQAQALQLPVLDVIARFVAPGQSAMAFQRGDLKANLSRGIIEVKRLGMSNPSLQLVVTGNVSLQSRVDLEATAMTNVFGLNAAALQLLAARVPPTGPVPVGVILEVASFFANRVVHLHVSGTVKNPSVRVEPLRLLTDEAVRFLVGQAVGVSTP